MSLMKFVSGSGSDKLTLTILEPSSDKEGYPVIIQDSYQGKNLPAKYGRAYLITGKDNSFFTLSGPIRRLDDMGIPIIEPKMKDGEYVTEKGEITNEGLAAKVNSYVTNSQTEQLVFSDLGTINIVNTKSDKTPTQFTLGSVKLYNDFEALEIAKKNYALSHAIKSSQIASEDKKDALEKFIEKTKSEIKLLQKNFGSKQNVFINDKTGFLESLGFEVRKKEINKDNNISNDM